MDFITYDIAILDWVHHHIIPHSIPVLQFISSTTTMISIASTSLVMFLPVVKKAKLIRMQFLTLVLVLILAAAAGQGIKALIDRDRPFTTFPDIEKLSTGGDSSFPSGHTVEAFAMAAALSLIFRSKKVVIPAYCWAVLVAYSRLALGVHYPSDILAGILIGSLIGWMVLKFMLREKGA